MIKETFTSEPIIPQNFFPPTFTPNTNTDVAVRMMEDGYALIPVTGVREDFIIDKETKELRMLGTPNRDYRKAKQPYTPYVRQGLKQATRDTRFAERWFGGAPFAAGIVCGPSGILVLDYDIDPEKGKDGAADLEWLKEVFDITFPEAHVQTPKGGGHIYMQAPEGWELITPSAELTIGERKTALDIRVGNAYVISPFSILPSPTDPEKVARYAGEIPPVSELSPVPEAFLPLLKWKDDRYSGHNGPIHPTLIKLRSYCDSEWLKECAVAKKELEAAEPELEEGDIKDVPEGALERIRKYLITNPLEGDTNSILDRLCRIIFWDCGLNDRQGLQMLKECYEKVVRNPEPPLPIFTLNKMRGSIDKARFPDPKYAKQNPRGWYLSRQLEELSAEDFSDIQALSDERTQGNLHLNPFPMDTLDSCFQFSELIRGHAKETRDPMAFVAVPGLVAFSSLLGNCHLLELAVGWREPGGMWGVNIGPPSCGKSPGYGAAMRPYEELNQLVETEQLALSSTCPPIKVKKPGRPKQGEENVEEVPVKANYIINFFTKEALIDNLYKNERGVMACNDEFAALIKKISPGGVDDGSFDLLNTFWVGKPQKATTKTSTSFDGKTEHYIQRSNFALCGNIQPDNLRNMRCTPVMWDNGHLCRYLVAFPVILPKPDDPIYRPMQQSVVDDYYAFVKYAFEHLYQHANINAPNIYHLSSDARTRFYALRQEVNKRVADETCARKKDFLSKLPTHVARLALTLHCMAWASRLGRSPSNQWHPEESIDLETLESAIKIAEWAYVEFCRLVEYMDGQKARGVAKSDSGYVLQILEEVGSITVTDLRNRRRFRNDPALLKKTVEELVDTGLAKTVTKRSGNGRDLVTVFKI